MEQQYPPSHRLLEEEYPHPGTHVHHEDAHYGRRAILAAIGLAGTGAIAATLSWRLGWFDGRERSAEPQAQTERGEQQAEAVLVLPPEFDRSREVNLSNANWRFMPGVAADDGGLTVTKTGLALRTHPDTWKGDTPEYIENPPINVYGTHLRTNSLDIGVAMRVSGVAKDSPAVINLYSEPDFTYDERRYCQPKTQVAVHQDRLVVKVWHGSGEEADETKEVAFEAPSDKGAFWLKQEGGQIIAGSNRQEVRFDADMFQSSGQMWFGLDGNFKVDSFAAYPAKKGAEVRVVDTSNVQLGKLLPNSLQTLAGKQRPDLLIGAAMNTTPITAYPSVAETIGQQFGALKPEMDGKMQAVYLGEPGADGSVDPKDFVWDSLDAFADMARRGGREYNLHTMAFGEAMPAPVERLLKDVADGKRPLQHAINFIHTYAKAYISRYPDAAAVDVVNEPLADTSIFNPTAGIVFNENAWYKAFGGKNGGERYIEVWCEAARKAGAKKILMNDNGAETWDERTRALIDIAAPLRRKGILDGVGLQAHLDGGDIDTWCDSANSDYENARRAYEHFSTLFARFARSNLEVQISELSIDEEGVRRRAVTADGLMRAAVRSDNVSAVFLWSPINGPWGFTAEPNGDYDLEPGNDGPWDWDEDRQEAVANETFGGLKHGLTA